MTTTASDIITRKLFEHEFKRIDKEILRINEKNCKILKKNNPGFWYLGNVYHQRGIVHTGLPNLSPELYEEADVLVKDLAILRQDKEQIKQIISRLISDFVSHYPETTTMSANVQNLRNALPECIVSLLPELVKLPRTESSNFLIKKMDERFQRQYEKLLPKIEMYAMCQLMY